MMKVDGKQPNSLNEEFDEVMTEPTHSNVENAGVDT